MFVLISFLERDAVTESRLYKGAPITISASPVYDFSKPYPICDYVIPARLFTLPEHADFLQSLIPDWEQRTVQDFDRYPESLDLLEFRRAVIAHPGYRRILNKAQQVDASAFQSAAVKDPCNWPMVAQLWNLIQSYSVAKLTEIEIQQLNAIADQSWLFVPVRWDNNGLLLNYEIYTT